MEYDFIGWATKNNLKCSDGLTIMKDAFKHCDGVKVPLVWNHQHNDPNEVLGHALLKNEQEGVRTYAKFNDTESGKTAKLLVEHGDIDALSIYANHIKRSMNNVIHGNICEVSLVLAGANPGAFIDSVVSHSDATEEEATIYTGEEIVLVHSDEESETIVTEQIKNEPEAIEHADVKKEDTEVPETKEGKTMQDVIDTMNEEQKNVMYALVGAAVEENKGGNKDMKHNVFDSEGTETNEVLSQSDMTEIMKDAKRYGSLKDAVVAHGFEEVDTLAHAAVDSNGNTVDYGIADVNYLFPEARNLNTPPDFIKRKDEWVSDVMTGVHHSPFSRIKSMFANITADDARARGYVKGNLKMEEVFTLLKRTTTPTTVYKKQKMDKDDIIDITDFNVVAWLKAEMRMMLDEELARAYLIGDGRSASSDDKINELNIRPIWTDADLYTIKKVVDVSNGASDEDKAKAFIKACIKARKDYRGSGNPTLYTTEDVLTDCLLIEDTLGRIIYDTEDKLRTTLRVKKIVTVPVMENLSRTVEGTSRDLMGIIVNLADYNVGADKGGAISMFEDFDIDYNQEKYLIETRCSGALIKPYSAIALECVEAGA